MSVTVKVFLEKASGSNEIRRFLVNTSAGNDFFTTTREKIRQLYPALANSKFTLYWQDPDGDRVAFSSLEEMRDALNYVTDGVFRVYISEPVETSETPDPQNQKKSSERQQPQSHQPNNSQPSGFSQSQPQGPSQSQPKGPQASSGHSGCTNDDQPLHPGIRCNGCGGPVKGICYKCCVCPDFDLCQTCKGKGVHSEHDMFKINHPHPFFQDLPGFSQNPPGFSQHHPGFSASSAHAGKGASFSSTCGSNPGMFGGANFHASANTNQKDKKSDKPSLVELFNQIGSNVSALLDLFGVKSNYDINDGTGSRQRESYHNWGPMGGRARQNCTTEECQAGAASKDGETRGQDAGPRTRAPDSADGSVPKEAGVNAERSSDQTDVPENVSVLRIPTSIPIPMPGPTSNPTPTSNSTPSSSSAAPPSAEETLPSAPAAVSQNSGQPAAASTEQQGSKPQTNLYPNLQVQQSLEQMLSMGFSDTDGWLTALLTEHDGNIWTTLDAIMAKATQQLDHLHGGR